METVKVLVVEDNPGDVRLVRESLSDSKEARFELDVATRLSEARDKLAKATFDVVLLDLGLPDSFGEETLKGVRAVAGSTPIVVLTLTSDDPLGISALSAGAQDFLRKGHIADPETLVRALLYAVMRSNAEEHRRLAYQRLQEIERLEELNAFKTRFLNTISHELSTPLTPIKLQLHLLGTGHAGALSAAQQRSVAMLDRNFQRLKALIDDMLDVTRLQSGQLRVHPQPVELRPLLQETVDNFADNARNAELTLSLACPSGVTVLADADRITQVLFNLLSNAIKFSTPGGSIAVTGLVEGREAVVEVKDNGAGLTSEQASRLFQPFSQVHERTTHPKGGTGLGLYICRGIIDQHGGRMGATSAGPGKGSVFSFTLPLAA